MIRFLAYTVIVLAVIAVAIGAMFIFQGISQQNHLTEAMRVERVTLGIEGEDEDQVIDTLAEAQKAGDTVRSHRRGIAASYSDLLKGEQFNPGDPLQLTYAQALNLENYLYLAVVAFGLVTVILAAGGFMIITGAALGITGIVLLKISRE